MANDWDICIVVPMKKVKGDVKNWSSCRSMKLLEHGMKVVLMFEKGYVP